MKRLVIIVWTALAFSCASLPVKQQASNVHQAVRTALTAFDDTEHAMCAPALADALPAVHKGDCTNPQAASVGLTTALNQQIASALVKAYDADKKVSATLIAWKAGDPAPADLPTLMADVQAAFAVVKSFAPGGSTILTQAQVVLDEVTKLVAVFAGGGQ